MKVQKEILFEKIYKASKTAFQKILKEKPDEQFFSFVLLTLDDVLSCYAYANSIESHQRTMERNEIQPNTKDEEYYKWSPQEWEYEGIEEEAFNEVYDCSEKFLEELKDGKFYKYKKAFIKTMENVLTKLDKEGVFGVGEERKKVTLFLTVSDSFMAKKVEKKSAKKLNPPEVYKAFKKRFQLHKLEKKLLKNEKATIKNKVEKLPLAAQIDYWIAELDHIVNERSSDVYDANFDFKEDFVLFNLVEIGEPSVMPLLSYVEKTLTIQGAEVDYDSLRFSIIRKLPQMKNKSEDVHRQLRKLFSLWLDLKIKGTTGAHLTDVLYNLFDGYPEPDFYQEKYDHFVEVFKKRKLE